ncbi:MAG: type II toxin-antitoxin system Phd/YefM family antitoxin [Anaerolineales bacterium]|nr:type II toxin-antitoxin system Phd/YefM family antitoxin [Anaerolineales bacterium]MCB9128140.1 type II toxin-antitoxin system Phd/YefM family antitoxin [Ardenticatenales bacterium]MCB9171850.1 type II toxin-antitoxin system Phd/YefM family antitoxin [Ardenticatenales bacterium]
MKTVTATELRANIYKLLDQVLATGVPLEVEKGGRRLRIAPIEPVDKFAKMAYRPDVINGDPESLVHVEWEYEIDLP